MPNRRQRIARFIKRYTPFRQFALRQRRAMRNWIVIGYVDETDDPR